LQKRIMGMAIQVRNHTTSFHESSRQPLVRARTSMLLSISLFPLNSDFGKYWKQIVSTIKSRQLIIYINGGQRQGFSVPLLCLLFLSVSVFRCKNRHKFDLYRNNMATLTHQYRSQRTMRDHEN